MSIKMWAECPEYDTRMVYCGFRVYPAVQWRTVCLGCAKWQGPAQPNHLVTVGPDTTYHLRRRAAIRLASTTDSAPSIGSKPASGMRFRSICSPSTCCFGLLSWYRFVSC